MKPIKTSAMKKLITIIVLLIPAMSVKTNVIAAILTAVSTGNWNTPGVWDSGNVPVCGDTIIVPSAFLIRITENVDLNDPGNALCSAVRISVSGRIAFNNGRKIRLAEGACMTVEAGGRILPSLNGGGSSENISFGNDVWWKAGDGALNGFATTGCPILLPVTLVSFETAESERGVLLTWTVQSEIDADYYLIEISNEGIAWTQLIKINAVGEQLGARKYTYEDNQVFSDNIRYYRLSLVDQNGGKKYLDTELWTKVLDVASGSLNVSPNPTASDQNITLSFDLIDADELELQVVNHLGQILYQEKIILSPNQKTHVMNPGSLNNGQYFVSLKSTQSHLQSKLIVL